MYILPKFNENFMKYIVFLIFLVLTFAQHTSGIEERDNRDLSDDQKKNKYDKNHDYDRLENRHKIIIDDDEK